MLAEINHVFRRHDIQVPVDWCRTCPYFQSLDNATTEHIWSSPCHFRPSPGDINKMLPGPQMTVQDDHPQRRCMFQLGAQGIKVTFSQCRLADAAHFSPSLCVCACFLNPLLSCSEFHLDASPDLYKNSNRGPAHLHMEWDEGYANGQATNQRGSILTHELSPPFVFFFAKCSTFHIRTIEV